MQRKFAKVSTVMKSVKQVRGVQQGPAKPFYIAKPCIEARKALAARSAKK